MKGNELVREKRTTRGVRINPVAEEDQEFDQEFYESEFWLDGQGSDEDSYDEQEEEVAVDEFDSDFNDTEDDDEEESDDDENPRRARSTDTSTNAGSNKYKEPKLVAPKIVQAKRKVEFSDDGTVKRKRTDTSAINHTPRTVRESTKSKSLDREISENLRKEALDLRNRQQQRQKQREKIKHQFEQEQLLLEGLETEITNQKWIENRKAMAKEDQTLAEKANKQKSEKEACIRYVSKRGQYNMIIFPSTESMPNVLKLCDDDLQAEKPKALCVITGQPAKYRDPKTMLPYATIDAYRTIKHRYHH